MTQRVVVTGGASGLGKAIARRYVDTGASVVIADIDPAAGKQAADELGARFHELDVTDAESFDALVQWCEAQLGGIDVLVNNAGVAAAGRFERIPLDDWDWILDINLMGVVRGCRAVVPLFKRQGSGHLVNIASLAALTTLPAMSSYNVSKAGVVALSQTLRHELAPYRIGTTVVCPGFVRTNLSNSLRSPDPEAQAVTERLMDRSDVTPEDVAEQVVTAQRKNTFFVLTHAEGRKFRFLERFLPALADKARIGFWQRLRSKIEAAPDATG